MDLTLKAKLIVTMLELVYSACGDLGKMSNLEAGRALIEGLNRKHPVAVLKVINDHCHTITFTVSNKLVFTITVDNDDITVITTEVLTDDLFASVFKWMLLEIHLISVSCALKKKPQ